ncbi:hypothetical protein NON00_00740 [Roseomonas sp. GC11]|uniref:hypothetical protein n=1 Tax=Roseomonas sp. GC11 TaxID=2950546 RepID=UPI002108A2D7|nr:hypothetical protein [Roseomonas sp. GC11]MCQ4158454.1 hypothetical protein [Roseomonas sp. GC11]
MSDAVSEAATRLERAVEKLAAALARPAPAAGVPPEAVAALSARLDETLSRLRLALAEVEAADSEATAEEEAESATPATPSKEG